MSDIKSIIFPIEPHDGAQQLTRAIEFAKRRLGTVSKIVFGKGLKDLLPQETIESRTPTGNTFWDCILSNTDFIYKTDDGESDCFGSVYGIPSYFETSEEPGLVACSCRFYP